MFNARYITKPSSNNKKIVGSVRPHRPHYDANLKDNSLDLIMQLC